MPANTTEIEKRLWSAADELRVNSSLKASEYSVPVLGLLFLRYADMKFTVAEAQLKQMGTGRREIGPADYKARGVMYVPQTARFSVIKGLPKNTDFSAAINDAMQAIMDSNEDLKGVLPRTYARLGNSTLIELLRALNSIPDDIEGDFCGKTYEYFLGKFAMSEGQKGGEFFTPLITY